MFSTVDTLTRCTLVIAQQHLTHNSQNKKKLSILVVNYAILALKYRYLIIHIKDVPCSPRTIAADVLNLIVLC